MGAAQGAADPATVACGGLWRCPFRSRPAPGERWQQYRCGAVVPDSGPPRSRSVRIAEAKGFEEALYIVSKDLERLAELHRKEQASVSKQVNSLNEDKESLAREVARLESLLLSGGCADRTSDQTCQAREEAVAESDLHSGTSVVSGWSEDADCKGGAGNGAVGSGIAGYGVAGSPQKHPAAAPDLDAQKPDGPCTLDTSDTDHRATVPRTTHTNNRPSSDLVHMAQMLRNSKLRTAWSELSDETVLAFSPCCVIEVINVHRRMLLGLGKQAAITRLRGSMRFLATSQEDQNLFSLCLFKSVLHPNSRPRLVWTSLTLLALFYDLVTIPLSAFDINEVVPALGAVDLAFLIFWAIDILMTFRTGYYVQGKVESRPYYIMMNYFKTWFCLDFFVVLVGLVSELAIMSAKSSALFRVARFFRILRILRLLRIAKLKQILDHIEDRINSNVLHLVLAVVKLVAGFGVIVHFTACTWYAVGTSTDSGWPTYDIAEGSKDLFFWYAASLRWTLAQVNGRTDLDERRNFRERMFTCVVAGGLAIILMAVFISSITAAMMELGSIAEERKKKSRRVNEFLKKNQISLSLTALIKHHSLETKTIEETNEDDHEILSYLPKAIQSDLFYEIRAPLLLGHPLFNCINGESKKVMWQICNEAMSPVIAEKDLVIFDYNDSCVRMLTMVKGILSYSALEEFDQVSQDGSEDDPDHVDDAGRPARSIGTDGQKISEAALWIEWHNRGRLVAVHTSYLVSLNALAFGVSVKQHLGAHARSIAYARAYLVSMREQDNLSDIMDVKAYFHNTICP